MARMTMFHVDFGQPLVVTTATHGRLASASGVAQLNGQSQFGGAAVAMADPATRSLWERPQSKFAEPIA